MIELLLLHNSVHKKVKRNTELINGLINFVNKFDQYYMKENSKIKYIGEKVYRGKLNYDRRIVFDVVNNLTTIVIWDIGDHNIYNLYDLKRDQYSGLIQLDSLINGNQFMQFEIRDKEPESIKEWIKRINFPEPYYYFDSYQREVLDYNTCKRNELISVMGKAGTGKTLMLNKLAYKMICENKEFIYIAFTSTLKDFFINYIRNISEECNDNINIRSKVQIFTYEEFLRSYIAPQLGINIRDYITFSEVHNIISGALNEDNLYKIKIKENVGLYNNELTRMVMSMFSSLDKDAKEEDVRETLQRRISKVIDKEGMDFLEGELETIYKVTNHVRNVVYNKYRKLMWSDLLKKIDTLCEEGKCYIHKNTIFIDEMQDLSQREFDLINKLWEFNNVRNNKILITAYDTNQRIAFDGNSERNLLNRGKDDKVFTLKYSYRNAYNIQKLASHFLKKKDEENEEEDIKTNLTNIPVKFLFEERTDYVIQRILQDLSIYDDISIGVLALGRTYELFKDNFDKDEIRSRYRNIHLFNEDQIKGLEFTNLIILNFMEPEDIRSQITEFDFRKWYVGITRAKDNLLIHFRDEDQLKELNRYIENYSGSNLLSCVKDQEYFIEFQNSHEAMNSFKKDLLQSDYIEKHSQEMKRAKELMDMYRIKNDEEYLEEALKIYNLEKSYNTIIEELENLNTKDEYLIYEITKAALNGDIFEKFTEYFSILPLEYQKEVLELANKIEENRYYDFITNNYKLNFKTKTKRDIEREQAEKYLKNGFIDNAVQIYIGLKDYRKVVSLYEDNGKLSFNDAVIKKIAKCFSKLGNFKEAAKLYLSAGEKKRAIEFYEYDSNYNEIYNICYNEFINNTSDIFFLQNLVDVALKLKNEEQLYNVLALTENEGGYKKGELYLELFIISGHGENLINSVYSFFETNNFDGVVRAYNMRTQEIVDETILEMIAEAYKNLRKKKEAAEIYCKINLKAKAIFMYSEIDMHDMVVSLYEASDLKSNKEVMIKAARAYEYLGDLDNAVCIYLLIEHYKRVVEICFEKEDFKYLIQIYESHKSFKFEKETINLIAKAYENINKYNQAAELYERINFYKDALRLYVFLGNHNHAISIYEHKVKEDLDENLKIQISKAYEVSNFKEKAAFILATIKDKDYKEKAIKMLSDCNCNDSIIKIYEANEKTEFTSTTLLIVAESYEINGLKHKAAACYCKNKTEIIHLEKGFRLYDSLGDSESIIKEGKETLKYRNYFGQFKEFISIEKIIFLALEKTLKEVANLKLKNKELDAEHILSLIEMYKGNTNYKNEQGQIKFILNIFEVLISYCDKQTKNDKSKTKNQYYDLIMNIFENNKLFKFSDHSVKIINAIFEDRLKRFKNIATKDPGYYYTRIIEIYKQNLTFNFSKNNKDIFKEAETELLRVEGRNLEAQEKYEDAKMLYTQIHDSKGVSRCEEAIRKAAEETSSLKFDELFETIIEAACDNKETSMLKLCEKELESLNSGTDFVEKQIKELVKKAAYYKEISSKRLDSFKYYMTNKKFRYSNKYADSVEVMESEVKVTTNIWLGKYIEEYGSKDIKSIENIYAYNYLYYSWLINYSLVYILKDKSLMAKFYRYDTDEVVKCFVDQLDKYGSKRITSKLVD